MKNRVSTAYKYVACSEWLAWFMIGALFSVAIGLAVGSCIRGI